MKLDADRLYELLPAYYRAEDEKNRGALKALLSVLASQARLIEADIETLYENWFIETCADWVVPYIGDLVGNTPLNPVVCSRRADVAKTIYYRRRKGTLPMLEELARDVTGWGCHAVEFFELLNWTQNVNHLRVRPTPDFARKSPFACDAVGTPNLRNLDALDRLHHPFEASSHSVDVRRCAGGEGRYSIKNIGFFLYRLEAFPLERSQLRRAAVPNSHGYFIHPLGHSAPIFNEPEIEDNSVATASETQVPSPIRPLAFYLQPDAYYGAGRALEIYRNGLPVPASELICKHLGAWQRPPAGKIGIDVALGRISFAVGEEPSASEVITCHYAYGFSAPIGGGPYDRRSTIEQPPAEATVYTVKQDPLVYSLLSPTHTDIASALAAFAARVAASPGSTHQAVIRIMDSRTYELPASVDLPGNGSLVIEAANGHRPCLVTGSAGLELRGGGATFAVRISGVLLIGFIHVTGNLGGLQLVHSTLVPGRSLFENGDPATNLPSVIIENDSGGTLINAKLQMVFLRCISGALRIPNTCESLRIEDSILDGLSTEAVAAEAGSPGPHTIIDRTTVFGEVIVQSFEASESIFVDKVTTRNTQKGCVRFSYVAPKSRVSRKYRCQPDLTSDAALEAAMEAGRLHGVTLSDSQKAAVREDAARDYRPDFTSRRYGQPAYAQLRSDVPCGIVKGSEGGSEMGAFCSIMQPQREANLRIRLNEYLPVGLEAGLIYVT